MKSNLNYLKSLLFVPVILFSIQSLNAQNTFPSTGSVGIGTTAPSSMLTIRPTGQNALEIRPASLSSSSTGEFRLLELTANGSQYVGFKAPSSIFANVMWVLPSTLGTSGQVLSRGSGSALAWRSVPALSLNNLSATSINVDLRPNSTGVRNLGTNTLRWNHGYFNGGVLIGNSTVNQAGMIRYNAGTFQGYNGSTWLNLSGGASGANTSLSNLTTTSINTDLIPSSGSLRNIGSFSNQWNDGYFGGDLWVGGILDTDGENLAIRNSSNNNFAAGGGRLQAAAFSANNIHIGSFSGGAGTTDCYDNTAVGVYTGSSMTGSSNTLMGAYAGREITVGFNNVLMGTNAGSNLTTGGGNTFMGHQSGVSVISGYDNTLVGNVSGIGLGNGSKNSFFGRSAGTNILDGDNNVCLGANTSAGFIEYAASGLTLVGADARTNGMWNNATSIGNGAIVNASNRVRLGNTSITRISGQVGFSIDSDRRLKQNVKDYDLGLEFINKLRPVSYEYTTNPEGGNRQGFIAQEVEEALGKNSFEGLSKPEHAEDFYAINYAAFVVPLVNAVKELSERVQELESKLNAQDEKGTNRSNAYEAKPERNMLNQNEPNPFNQYSKIRYSFNHSNAKGRLVVIDMNGKQVQEFAAPGSNGEITIEKGNLAAGIYTYLLFDGVNLIEAKQMIIN